MIYITGDTHGEQGRFFTQFDRMGMTEKDYLIICGDFGFLFLDNETERMFLNDLEKRPYTILFVDGNHENFPLIDSFPRERWHGGWVHRIRKNVLHLTRGQIFEIGGKTFFTFGGAYSIDRAMRSLGKSYWEEELPSSDDYHEALRNLRERNYRVDYILTHTAPREIIGRMGFHPDGHDLELTGFFDYLLYEVTFRHWFFGHWHIDRDLEPNFSALWFGIKQV